MCNAPITDMLTLQLHNHLITHENVSLPNRCFQIFEIQRLWRFFLVHAEGARLRALHSPSWNKWNNPAAILCSTCCLCIVLGFICRCQSTRMLQLCHSWPLEGGCAPQGLSGWMALEFCCYHWELGWWQPDFSCKVCLRIAWFLLKPFTVEVIITVIHLLGFWCYCKKICCVVPSTQNLLVQICQLGRMTQIYTFG